MDTAGDSGSVAQVRGTPTVSNPTTLLSSPSSLLASQSLGLLMGPEVPVPHSTWKPLLLVAWPALPSPNFLLDRRGGRDPRHLVCVTNVSGCCYSLKFLQWQKFHFRRKIWVCVCPRLNITGVQLVWSASNSEMISSRRHIVFYIPPKKSQDHNRKNVRRRGSRVDGHVDLGKKPANFRNCRLMLLAEEAESAIYVATSLVIAWDSKTGL